MNSSKHRFIIRTVWTRGGIANFEQAVNDLINQGWEPGSVEISRGAFKTICMAVLHKPPDKCECECSCCLEMHHGSCSCDCDCCLAHAHRDGSYPTNEDDD